MLAWVTIDRQHKPYLSPIFARAIHKGIGMKIVSVGTNFALY